MMLRLSEFTSRGHSQHHVAALARVAAKARRHFPEGSSAAILEAIEPLLCPKDPQVPPSSMIRHLPSPTPTLSH